MAHGHANPVTSLGQPCRALTAYFQASVKARERGTREKDGKREGYIERKKRERGIKGGEGG